MGIDNIHDITDPDEVPESRERGEVSEQEQAHLDRKQHAREGTERARAALHEEQELRELEDDENGTDVIHKPGI